MQASLGSEIRRLVATERCDEAKERLAAFRNGVVDEEGNTMYHEAINYQDVKLLRWLLANYQLTIKADTANSEGTTCFHLACSIGSTACFYELWEKSDVHPTAWSSYSDKDGQTPLHIACQAGHQSVAQEILNKGGQKVAYALNDRQQTALHLAAAGGQKGCIVLLAQYKKLINLVDQFGATALHYAVNEGHLASTQYLVERCKADKSIRTRNGMNLLHSAIASGSLSVVKYVYSKTKNTIHVGTTATGATVLHIATGLGFEDILHFLLTRISIYSLINYADINGWTAAHLAAMRNQPACLAILIGFNADVFAIRDKDSKSVYQILREKNTAEMKLTFPYIFSQLEAEDEPQRQSRYQSRYEKKKEKQNSTLSTTEDKKRTTSKKNGKHVVGRTLSDVINKETDSTKSNPLVKTDLTSLKKRKFQTNNMALPRNGYTDKMPVMAYQLGIEGDSDSDFEVDSIENMPQTPLRIIQKYNNFAHSTYTPPQSLEDLTKIDSLTEELSSRSGKPSLPPASKPTAGDHLPVVLDYTNLQEADDAITIYFHNGELNTVKVKTFVRQDDFPSKETQPENVLLQSEILKKPAEDGKTMTTTMEVHQELEVDNSEQALKQELVDSISNSLAGFDLPDDTSASYESVNGDNPTPGSLRTESSARASFSTQEMLTGVQLQHEVENSISSQLLPANATNNKEDSLVTPKAENLLVVEPQLSAEQDGVSNISSHEETKSEDSLRSSPSLPPFSPPIASQSSLPDIIGLLDQKIEFPTHLDNDQVSSVPPESTLDKNAEGAENMQEMFGATEEIPQSPDTMEKEYLKFAENELKTDEEKHGNSADIDDRMPETANSDNDNAVRGEGPSSAADAGSKTPDGDATGDTNFDLRSSTAYKLNYRAYKKKISNKHDTVSNLFEYDPLG